MKLKEKVQLLVEDYLKEKPEMFLMSITCSEVNDVLIVIDSDKGIKVQDCIDLNRYIDNYLREDDDAFDFSLEITSYGVSKSLLIKRQYYKNIGRALKVETIENKVYKGELTKVNDESIELQWSERKPKKIGKGKETVLMNKEVPYKQIKTANILIKI